MVTNYTPLSDGLDATAATFNAPLAELDGAIEGLCDGTKALTAPDITAYTNAQHDHSDAANGGVLPFDNLDTTGETAGKLLAVGSSNNVVTVSDKWEVGDLLPKAKVSDTGNIWLRCDGRTVGSAASSATARANADMETLFTHLWTEFSDVALPIQDSGGTPVGSRGADAATDWANDRRLPVPDFRGRVLAGMDDPTGSSAANVVTDVDADVMGGGTGAETHTLTGTEIPDNQIRNIVHPTEGPYGYARAAHSGDASSAHNNIQPTGFINWFIYTGN